MTETSAVKNDKTRQLSMDQLHEIDSRSIFVGNVEYKSTPEELQEFFSKAGLINRITILNNKFTGKPRGYAYIEFEDKSSIDKLIELNGSAFHGRDLKVVIKRTNLPGYSRSRRKFRGRNNHYYRGNEGNENGSELKNDSISDT